MAYSLTCTAQKESIRWINFEQLEDSLTIRPKKVFVHFYTDWCTYCKKMEEAAFKNPIVITTLNSEYYNVKMNAESRETIKFGGKHFINKNIGKSRTPFHEIPLLLGSKENQPFTLPVTIILNKQFRITRRYFEYLSSKKLLKVILDSKSLETP